jgi:hydroxyethylthiazole kinase-like uncharacterized protein yjeF
MKPHTITKRHVASFLAARPHDSHKGMFGTVVIIGGASGMIGAALLAGRAALKLGAGSVHVVLLGDNAPAIDFVQPELMLHSYKRRDDSHPGSRFNPDVMVIGCGMGTEPYAQHLLADTLSTQTPLVLDADALHLIAIHADLRDRLITRKAAAILTPHPGEAARLLACSTTEIQKNRIASAHDLAKMFNCSVVLKGAGSLCANHNGEIFINQTGNPGMSAPGMGDVLAGMIAAFIAQGLSADNALLLAVHLHGAAGDELAKHTALGMTATELTDQARRLLNQWQSN